MKPENEILAVRDTERAQEVKSIVATLDEMMLLTFKADADPQTCSNLASAFQLYAGTLVGELICCGFLKEENLEAFAEAARKNFLSGVAAARDKCGRVMQEIRDDRKETSH